MKPAAGRLLLTAVLFAGWLCYLGYLVWTRPRVPTTGGELSGLHGQPLVLSRPQFLVSSLDVVARVDEDGKGVKVVEVLYPADKPPVHQGEVISVEDFAGPHTPPEWSGPGEYLLPLLRLNPNDKKHYRVTPIPSSPGYARAEPRIYPATPEALAQYRKIPKPVP
jgi:hypothetical protein